MKIIILLSLIAVTFGIKSRVKIGSNRWAFNIGTNEGKNVRKEYVDENGVVYGLFSFLDVNNKQRQFLYKCDAVGDEPEYTINEINENGSLDQENTNDGSNEIFTKLKDIDYESINGSEEFSGHVSFKVGKFLYSFSLSTGDKTRTREESIDETGVIHGRYTFFNENKGSTLIVNYNLNPNKSDPTLEAKMHKIQEKLPQGEKETFVNNYDPNQLTRQVLFPNQQYANSIPSITLWNRNPPHNLVTPMQGNWYYRT